MQLGFPLINRNVVKKRLIWSETWNGRNWPLFGNGGMGVNLQSVTPGGSPLSNGKGEGEGAMLWKLLGGQYSQSQGS